MKIRPDRVYARPLLDGVVVGCGSVEKAEAVIGLAVSTIYFILFGVFGLRVGVRFLRPEFLDQIPVSRLCQQFTEQGLFAVTERGIDTQ